MDDHGQKQKTQNSIFSCVKPSEKKTLNHSISQMEQKLIILVKLFFSPPVLKS